MAQHVDPWPTDPVTGAPKIKSPPLPNPMAALVDANGRITPEWYQYFQKQRLFLDLVMDRTIALINYVNTLP